MVIKDIIYIMVVPLFTVACWLQVESIPRGVKLLPLGLSTWGLLLLVGSRWNMFHVEPDYFMPRNNLSKRHPPEPFNTYYPVVKCDTVKLMMIFKVF